MSEGIASAYDKNTTVNSGCSLPHLKRLSIYEVDIFDDFRELLWKKSTSINHLMVYKESNLMLRASQMNLYGFLALMFKSDIAYV